MWVNYGGVGLGLVILKELVLKFGGKISVEFVFGKGSCFFFMIDFGDIIY